MTFKAKASGSHYERVAKKMLEEEGWIVTRAGASLGDYDLVAVWPNPSIYDYVGEGLRMEAPLFGARLIQVKSTKDKYRKTWLLKGWDKPGEMWVYLKKGDPKDKRKGKWFFK